MNAFFERLLNDGKNTVVIGGATYSWLERLFINAVKGIFGFFRGLGRTGENMLSTFAKSNFVKNAPQSKVVEALKKLGAWIQLMAQEQQTAFMNVLNKYELTHTTSGGDYAVFECKGKPIIIDAKMDVATICKKIKGMTEEDAQVLIDALRLKEAA